MSPGSRRTTGAATRAHMTNQLRAATQELPASVRRKTKSPPLPLISANQAVPTHNPHCIAASPIVSSANPSIPPPPDTPPPLEDAYRQSQPPESASGCSSSCSSPEASYPPSYPSSSRLHSANRISHSPEAAYATTSHNHLTPSYGQNIRSWEHSPVDTDHRPSTTEATGYGYPDADTAPSPASSTGGGHPSSQPHSAHSVSPQSPYAYSGHYGMQHGSASQVGLTGARTTGTLTSMRHTTPPPPLVQSTPYSQNYSSNSPNNTHDPAISIAGYSSNSQGRGQDPSSVTSSSAIAHQPYPHHYLTTTNTQAAVPNSHHYTHTPPHGTPSQSRQNSPPVVLAPIQNDRLAPRSTPQSLPSRNMPHAGNAQQQQQQQHLQQPQSQHPTIPAADRVSSSHGPHHVGLATTYSSQVHQPQPQQTHGGGGGGQAHQYPYSNYSTLSANNQNQQHQTTHHVNTHTHHDNWRSDHYHHGARPNLSHSHSMSSAGLAV
ncbi:hypothetical protein BC835DRAFT_193098 [Cytidiella melzeri]|nr:hypothetical protein BC835DRAFT_193098 [Cytidiella melzeri]